MKASLIALVSLLLALLSSPSGAQSTAGRMKPAAREHLDRGLSEYQKEQFDAAIEEFEKGYAIDPRPEFLYALGQSERRRGDCNRAVEHYEGFLRASPSGAQADAVRFQLKRCQQELRDRSEREARAAAAAREAASTPVAPAATQANPASAPRADATIERRPWYKDWIGNALTGAGVAALATGTLLFVDARGTIADGSRSYEHYLAARDAEGRQSAGVVMMAAGGGLVAAGVLHYLFANGHSGTSVALLPSQRGAALLLAGRF